MTARGQVSPVLALARGLLHQCPRCGARGMLARWSTLAERCPLCELRFDRRPEDGFFLGAMMLNIAVTEGALAIVVIGYIFLLASGGGRGSLAPVIALGLVAAVVVPIAFYPTSKTLWAAVDLLMRPPPDADAQLGS